MNWQPIETAPRDGTKILMTRKDPWSTGDIVIAFWHHNRNPPCFVAAETGGGLPIDTSRWVYWMPIPELAEPIPPVA